MNCGDYGCLHFLELNRSEWAFQEGLGSIDLATGNSEIDVSEFQSSAL
jgi:hypothetical protein